MEARAKRKADKKAAKASAAAPAPESETFADPDEAHPSQAVDPSQVNTVLSLARRRQDSDMIDPSLMNNPIDMPSPEFVYNRIPQRGGSQTPMSAASPIPMEMINVGTPIAEGDAGNDISIGTDDGDLMMLG